MGNNFTPAWIKKGFFNESIFCDDFLSTHQLLYSNGAFFTPEGRVSAGTIWNTPTTSSILPGGVSGALWASKPLCSLTSPPMAGGHDPLLIPLYGAFSVFRCVRAYRENRLLRTHVRSKTPKFSFIGGVGKVSD